MSEKTPEDKEDSLLGNSKPAINAYLKYSGMGIQMAFIIGIFAWLGLKMDVWLKSDPVFVVILSLSGVALSMYIFIRQILSEPGSQNKVEDED
jgi:F0F1-type ATP synthase assembly protein I